MTEQPRAELGQNPLEQKVAEATTVQELKEILKKEGLIKGSKDSFQGQELIRSIQAAEAGGAVFLNLITRSFGIRAKVRDLLNLPKKS